MIHDTRGNIIWPPLDDGNSASGSTNTQYQVFGPQDGPILLCFGQSNAGGHGTSGRTIGPLANVKVLSRADNINMSETVTWVQFTNRHCLGADYSNTYNMAGEFAKLWQAHIDAGNENNLPDLYVIWIAWESQGIDDTEQGSNNRWYIGRSDTNVDSLFHLAKRKIRGAIKDIRSEEKLPRIIALDWNQWETEAWSAEIEDPSLAFRLAQFFSELFSFTDVSLNPYVKNTGCPVYMHKPRSTVYHSGSTALVTKVIDNLVAGNENFHYIDPKEDGYAGWSDTGPRHGIFLSDNVHYEPATQTWFATELWSRIFDDDLYGPTVNTLGSGGVVDVEDRVVSLESGITKWTAGLHVNNDNIKLAGLTAIDSSPTASNTRMAVVTTDAANTRIPKAFRFYVPTQTEKYMLYLLDSAPSDAFYGTVRIVVRSTWSVGACFRWTANGTSKEATTPRTGSFGTGRYIAVVPYDYTGSVFTNKFTIWAMKDAPHVISNNLTMALPANRATIWYEVLFEFLPDSNGLVRMKARRASDTTASFVTYASVANVNTHAQVSEDGLRAPENNGLGGRVGIVLGLGVTTDWNGAYGVPRVSEIEFLPYVGY